MHTSRPPVWVTPLPPVGSGIAQYSRDILRSISGCWDFELLAEPGSGTQVDADWRPISLRRVKSNPRPIIQIGNSGYHPFAFRLAERPGSVLVLHDVVLHHARLAEFVRKRRPGEYIKLMSMLYGQQGEDVANNVLRGAAADLTTFSLSEDLISRAACVVVHSQFARDKVSQLVPDCNVRVIPMGVPLPVRLDKRLARRHLGIPEDAFVVASITHVNPMKRMPVVLRAFRQLVEKRQSSMLVIAGSISASVDLQRQVDLLGLSDNVRLSGYMSDNDAAVLAQASDVAVNLRFPSTGETSASLLRLLGAGLPVVVTAHGSSLEIPEVAAIHLPVDRFEEETLVAYLSWLASDNEARQAYGENARKFVVSEHSMANAVQGYRDVLNSVWNLDLPAVDVSHLDDVEPALSDEPKQAAKVIPDMPTAQVYAELAAGLHFLGLSGHDGTIHEAASALDYLELRDTTGGNLMATEQGRSIDPQLLEILACPVCKVRVRLEESELVCDQCGRHYRIENGIPIMLVDESE
jgi:glycosyltransferase involved in cell wall biosynthesis/uncharacterized protein YbaR (Trm112 family)